MSWWGKIVGGALGLMLGGGNPLGALLGAAVGHQFDKGLQRVLQEPAAVGDPERVQAAFFTATFAMLGHLAKADGRVSEDEINYARHVMGRMQLTESQRKAAIELFYQGKRSEFAWRQTLAQFRKECHGRRNLVQMFLEIQITAALSDGDLHNRERDLLAEMADVLGWSGVAFATLMGRIEAELRFARQQHQQRPHTHTQATQADAYAVLGLSAQASDQDVKKAYRRLMNQHHPDKLVAKGLPEEMLELAKQKTQEIRAAYEQIKRQRGMR